MAPDPDKGKEAAKEAAKETLRELKVQRATLLGSLTRLKALIEGKAGTMVLSDLETRLGLLENNFSNMMTIQSNIEKLSAESFEDLSKKRVDLEEHYCGIKSRILAEIERCKKSTTVPLDTTREFQTSVFAPPHLKCNLPKLKLPEFTGNYTEWTNFIGTFTSLVHEDGELSKIEKFQHLVSCLGEKPLQIIRDLERTPQNYDEALKLLTQRYQNKRIIFQSHIKEIFSLSRATKGTSTQLREVVDLTNAHLRALRSIGDSQAILDAFLVHLIISKLDAESLSKWDDESATESMPSWDSLSKFLSRRATILENRSWQTETQKANKSKPRSSCMLQTNSGGTSSKGCLCCKEGCSALPLCPRFKKMSPLQRFYEVKRLSLCLNCLKGGHSSNSCSAKKCDSCLGSHHKLLHRPRKENESTSTPSTNSQTPVVSPESVPSYSNSQSHLSLTANAPPLLPSSNVMKPVLLATALILVQNRAGVWVPCRALLDAGSQLNFMTEKLVQALNIRKAPWEGVISGIGSTNTSVRSTVQTRIRSRVTEYQQSIDCCVLKTVTGWQPNAPIDIKNWKIPANLELADPEFPKPQKIDLLLGASVFYNLLAIGQIRLGNNLPILQKTTLGWVVTGEYPVVPPPVACCLIATTDKHDNGQQEPEDDLLTKLWALEEFPSDNISGTPEHADCEVHFATNHRRAATGRFIVRLPLRCDPSELGDSFECAKRRFFNLEKKLIREPRLQKQYSAFIQEYEQLGHMEIVPKKAIPSRHYFLPHHCVIRPESTSTKLRVVFDASCKSTSNLSLNDILMVGPTIQPELFEIVVRFRLHPYVITADITKMYRQILVDPADTNLQLIVWRDEPTEELKIFRLTTVTYGTAAAPFLATRCLKALAEEYKDQFPLGSAVLNRDFYMDDMLSGANSIEECISIRHQVAEILRKGEFDLRKWCSNEVRTLKGLSEEEKETLLELQETKVTKALGIVWEPCEDNFQFRNSVTTSSSPITKRTVLSDMAKIFDPLGLMNLVLVVAKIFLQQLWILKVDWDESLPQHLHSQWVELRRQLNSVQLVKFPRFVLTHSANLVEIHGFSDASERAYGAAIYMRSMDSKGNILVRLLCAKSRVAPVKTVSIPRLELCGALLLEELIARLHTVLHIKITRSFCWTDSTVVLAWLASHASTWTPFVANRVSKIQELSRQMIWNHVDTKNNPADIVSRGMLPLNLISSKLWIDGPNFLRSPETTWPTSKKTSQLEEDLPDRRKAKFTILTARAEREDLVLRCKFANDFDKLRRIFAYVLRFTNRARSPASTKQLPNSLTASELAEATRRMIWNVQQTEFGEDIHRLESSSRISPKSCLRTLSPFLEDNSSNCKLLRVSGRLQNADLPFEVKHPILLPKRHPFVLALINYYHKKHFHAGVQALTAILRQQYWILHTRSTIRFVLSRCLRCLRAKPRLIGQIMGNLPAARARPARPFCISGVDFCGPFLITTRMRGQSPRKAYIAVFVCFSIKAVHLEVVSDLTICSGTEAVYFPSRTLPSPILRQRHQFCRGKTTTTGVAGRILLGRNSRVPY